MGGSIRNLAQHQVRGLWWLVLAAAMQLVIGNAHLFEPLAGLTPLLHVVSFVPLFWAIWLNRRLGGMLIIGVGSLLNFAAIVANGGKMPVGEEALHTIGETQTAALLRAGESFTHTLVGPGTHLVQLGDVIAFPDIFYVFPHTAVSIGDIVLALGAVVLICSLMRRETAQVQTAPGS